MSAPPAERVGPVQNWSRTVTFSAERLVQPTTVEQLQHVVAAAPRVRALGSGHSFSRIADTDGLLVNVENLDLPVELDEQARTVGVGAGVRYGRLAAFLQERGWALHNLGSLPHITVGGACATGTHGSGVGNPCLAAAAVAVEFVRADGELVRIERGDPRFGGAVISLGALGVTTRLWLAVQPTYDIAQHVWLDAPLERVLADLDGVLAGGYSVSLFSRWTDPAVVDQIWIKGLADATPVDGTRWGARPASGPQHPIRGLDGATATRQLGVPGPWHERLPHFRMDFTPSNGEEVQSEWFVERAVAADALAAVAALPLSRALMVAEIRAVAADDTWLGPAHGRDSVALHFTWVDDDRAVAEAVARVEAALAGVDARPHWGKVFGQPAEQVRAHYADLPRFRELAMSCDPERAFGNEFLRRYVY